MVLRSHHIEVCMQLMVEQILGEEMGLLDLDTFLGKEEIEIKVAIGEETNECPMAGQMIIFYQIISKREG